MSETTGGIFNEKVIGGIRSMPESLYSELIAYLGELRAGDEIMLFLPDRSVYGIIQPPVKGYKYPIVRGWYNQNNVGLFPNDVYFELLPEDTKLNRLYRKPPGPIQKIEFF